METSAFSELVNCTFPPNDGAATPITSPLEQLSRSEPPPNAPPSPPQHPPLPPQDTRCMLDPVSVYVILGATRNS